MSTMSRPGRFAGGLVALLLGWPAAPLPLSAAAETSAPAVMLEVDPDEHFSRHSEGDLIELRDGTLALVYTRFKGGDSDHSAADLVLRASPDRGATWGDGRVLVPNEGGCNVMSVSLVRLPDNEIRLFYLRKDSAEGACHVLVRRSSDELRTLSEPVRVSLLDGYHVMNNARVIRTSSGRLIAPVVLHSGFPDETTSSSRFSAHGVPFVYYSDDEGRSWKRDSTPVARPTGSGAMLQENGVVELADGRLWMYMRTDAGSQFGCHSCDGGLTWSQPQRASLPSPLSPASVRRIPWSGDLLCIWNDHSGRHPFPRGKRSPLCAAVSRDGGLTWTPSQVIEGDPRGWFCYTSILFQKDRALISYCAGDPEVGLLNRLRVTSLSREWIDAAGATAPVRQP